MASNADFSADTSSYAVWSENNHTNTNITLETMNDLRGAKVWLNLFLDMTDVMKGVVKGWIS
jgi:hypothetical protein